MIIVRWSAVTGYVSHRIDSSDLVITPIDTKMSASVQSFVNTQNHSRNFLQTVLGVPRQRASKGNHQWKLSMIKKELKRRQK